MYSSTQQKEEKTTEKTDNNQLAKNVYLEFYTNIFLNWNGVTVVTKSGGEIHHLIHSFVVVHIFDLIRWKYNVKVSFLSFLRSSTTTSNFIILTFHSFPNQHTIQPPTLFYGHRYSKTYQVIIYGGLSHTSKNKSDFISHSLSHHFLSQSPSCHRK